MNDPIRFTLADGLELAGGDLDELWWRYVGIGGEADAQLLAERISGVAPCDTREYSTIAQALNECFVDRGLNTFPVGYRPRLAASARRDSAGSAGPGRPGSRSAEARRRAVEARVRSAAAAQHAALLHLTAARLMLASGQLQYARRAQERADRALARASQPVWVA